MSRLRRGVLAGVLCLGFVACGGESVDPEALKSPPIESPAGFRLKWPGPGWQLLDGEKADALYPGALAGALGPSGAAFVWRESTQQPAHVVIPELVTRLTQAGVLRENEGAEVSGQPAQRFTIDVPRDGGTLYLRGVVVSRNGEALILANTSHDDRPESYQPIIDALELTDPDAPAVPVAAEPAPQTLVLGSAILRKGTYHDFAHGVAWTRPDAKWRLVAGHDARQVDPTAVAVMDHEGITAMLFVDDGPSGKTAPPFKDVIWSEESKPINLEDEGGRLWSGRVRKVGRPVNAITATRDDVSVAIVAWSLVGEIPEPQLNAIAKGLQVSASRKAEEMSMSGYQDHRLGFELELPSGWLAEHPDAGLLSERGSFVRFRSDDRWIGVLSVQADTTREALWEDFLQRRIGESFAHSALGDAKTGKDELGELEAKHVVWSSSLQQVDLWLVHREGRVHAIVTVDQNTTAAELVRKGFRLTD